MKDLYKALIKAQQAAKLAPLDGRNNHHGYDYTTASTMYRLGKQTLNAHGLALVPTGLELEPCDESIIITEKSGRRVLDAKGCNAHRAFLLVHESGEAVEFVIQWPLDLQGGKRPRDKACAASDTTVLSYAYRDILAIGKLKDGEVDNQATPTAPRRDAKGVDRDAAGNVAPRPLGEHTAATSSAERKALANEAKPAPRPPVELPPRAISDEPTDREPPARPNRMSDSPDVRLALSLGCIAGDENTPGNALITCELPADPGKDDLEGAGMDPQIAEELALFDARAPVSRKTTNQLNRAALEAHGLKGAKGKKWLIAKFEAVGVDVVNKSVPNGYQLRLWALDIYKTAPKKEEVTA